MIKIPFLVSIAKYIVEDKPIQLISQIAIDGLEEGFSSASLLNLAGITDLNNVSLIHQYFDDMLVELHIHALDSKEKSSLLLIKWIAIQIITNQIDAFDGCKQLFEQFVHSFARRSEDDRFVYDSVELAEVYGSYDTINELLNSTVEWNTAKTNTELIDELKQIIKAQLTSWLLRSI